MRYMMMILFLVSFVFSASADVWLIIDKNSKDVISMSSSDDAQLPNNNYEKIILPGKLIDYLLAYHPQYYKYQSDRFVVNIEKLSDEALAQQEAEEIAEEEKEVRKWIRNLGIDELEKGGKIFKHIKKEE